MELLEIKEYVSPIAPATYELYVKINSEIMLASFDIRTRLEFYDAFTSAFSSNIYSFKKEHYPNEKISFISDSGAFWAYSEHVQKKYLEIFQALNYKTDEIIEQSKDAFSYRDKDKMKNFIDNFISQHFSNHEIEKEKNLGNPPRVRMFTLYEDLMHDMYHIGLKINDAEIIKDFGLTAYNRVEEFLYKSLSKNLYEFKKSHFPNERMSFSEKTGTLFTFKLENHSSFLKVLKSLNKESYEILTTLKNMDLLYNNPVQGYLETYISQHFLRSELSELPEKANETSPKKIKI